MLRALVVDDDVISQSALAELVRDEGFQVQTAGTLTEARTSLRGGAPDVLLLDVKLPDGSGLDFLRELDGTIPSEIVLITGNGSVDSAVDAIRHGAADYLTKPPDIARLQSVLVNVVRRHELKGEIGSLRRELRGLGRFGNMIGSSPAMQGCYDLIGRVAPTDASVLIVGESGTGKELVAETIHRMSRRKDHPFIAMNCGAVSPTLIESELFGHERGSFTGAAKIHKGFFERAHGGTLLLDEITEMPMESQVRLLRVLETSKVVRVGGEEEIPVDIRVIAATNRSTDEAVEQGKLREDLLYRLGVFPIHVPAAPRPRPGRDVARRALPGRAERRERRHDQALHARSARPSPAPQLAGQRTRAQERRASRHDPRRRGHRAGASSARAGAYAGVRPRCGDARRDRQHRGGRRAAAHPGDARRSGRQQGARGAHARHQLEDALQQAQEVSAA
jgi:DNA-binding NtrC family response regulator